MQHSPTTILIHLLIMTGLYPLAVTTLRDATHYKMDHPRRGMALIFNHQYFENKYVSDRDGTNIHCGLVQNSLKNLGFDVKVHHNLATHDIEKTLEKVSEMDHKDYDCLVVVVMTHGSLGKLYAYDAPYDIDMIFSYFTAEKCKSLVGKPKIFFIQACQGDMLNPGVSVRENMETDTYGSQAHGNIPAYADFLVVHSTVPGYDSWSCAGRGSWFIEVLYIQLDENAMKCDLFSLLTFVARRVTIDFERKNYSIASLHWQKQIPHTSSMLMRIIQFVPPRNEGTINDPMKGI